MIMDLPSVYWLLHGGMQPPQQQPSVMPIMGRMGRMTGSGLGFGGHPGNMDPAWLNNPTFGATAYKNTPVSHLGTPMHPDMVGNAGMPILNSSSAPQQSGQPQGQQAQGGGDLGKYMMLTGGLNTLFDALRGS